jgi:type I restriction enzyme R subunit
VPKPEDDAREIIDTKLATAGWIVQDRGSVNLGAGIGIAVREFSLKPGHGTADYLLYVDAEALGVIEAKPSGATLTSAEAQARCYSEGLPDDLNAHHRPLPFVYQASGTENHFTNFIEQNPRSRDVFRPNSALFDVLKNIFLFLYRKTSKSSCSSHA